MYRKIKVLKEEEARRGRKEEWKKKEKKNKNERKNVSKQTNVE